MSQQDTFVSMALKTAIVSGFLGLTTLLLVGLAGWSFTRALLLAPVLVAVAGILAFWGLIALTSLRDASRPRRAMALAAALLVVLAIVQLVLNHYGVQLPDERF
jgi:NO-binding membrane sensor protein with MHYT domain